MTEEAREPRVGTFDKHVEYLRQIVKEWEDAASYSSEKAADTQAWIEAHTGLLWLYDTAVENVDPKQQQDADFGQFNFFGVGHAIQQVVSQFSWRPDYPFKDTGRPRPPRRRPQ